MDDEKLRLDIGYSHDLAKFELKSGKMAVGADFFTYTRLRSDGRFKFPVETSDYFFGLNGSYITEIAGKELGLRLRLSHISSHLVDGYSSDGEFWKEPFTYSREFLEFSAGWYIFDNVRVYAGINYIFSSIPDDIEAITPQFGFDAEMPINNSIELVCGFDHRTIGIDSEYAGANNFEGGVNFITSENAKISLFYSYYSGRSIHGMFYKEFDKYSSIGFKILFY